VKEIELLGKRGPREKHFLREDGTIKAEVYDTDIHFLKDGKYEEIDNTLIENDKEIINKSNSFKAKFNKNLEDKYLIKMNKDNLYLNIKLNNMNNTVTPKLKNFPNKLDNEILYTDILDNISIDYKTIGNKVKETIILKNKCNLNLEFEVETNLKLKIDSNNIIAYSYDNTIFTIDKPFMIDSNNIRNDNISYNLINENKNLICSIIKKYTNYYEFDDLYQVSVVGIIKAYKNYNVTSDAKFSTYAYKYILSEVINFVNNSKIIKTSREYNKLYKKILEAKNILTQRLMKEPNTQELALFLEIDESIINDVISLKDNVKSLDSAVNKDGKTLTLLDSIASSNYNIDNDNILLQELLSTLDEKEIKLLDLRYFQDKTQSEVAKYFHTNQVQISRNETKILKKLKNNLYKTA